MESKGEQKARGQRPGGWAQALALGGSQGAHLTGCVNTGRVLLATPQSPHHRRLPSGYSPGFFVVEGQQDNLCKVPGEGQAFLKVPISGASSTHYTGTGLHSCHLAECPLNPLWGRRGWCGEVA